MSVRILCDYCDQEVDPVDLMVLTTADDGLRAEEELVFHFCSWLCLLRASQTKVEPPPALKQYIAEEEPRYVSEPTTTAGQYDPEVRKIMVKRVQDQVSETHGKIILDSTPLEERQERNDNSDFGGVHRR